KPRLQSARVVEWCSLPIRFWVFLSITPFSAITIRRIVVRAILKLKINVPVACIPYRVPKVVVAKVNGRPLVIQVFDKERKGRPLKLGQLIECLITLVELPLVFLVVIAADTWTQEGRFRGLLMLKDQLFNQIPYLSFLLVGSPLLFALRRLSVAAAALDSEDHCDHEAVQSIHRHSLRDAGASCPLLPITRVGSLPEDARLA